MTEVRWWHQLTDPRFLIALIVLGLFGWALGDNPDDDTMKGALIGALNLAAGYYLGSSRGAAQSQDIANKAMDVAVASQPDPATPQAVTVTNEPDEPMSVVIEQPVDQPVPVKPADETKGGV